MHVWLRKLATRAIRGRAFAKVELRPGEMRTVTLTLDKRAFAHFDVLSGEFRVQAGTYRLRAGASSRDLRLEAEVRVESTAPPRPVEVHANATLGDLLADPVTGPVLRELLQEKLAESPLGSEIDGNPTLEAFLRFTAIGRVPTLFGVPRDEIGRILEMLREAQNRSGSGAGDNR